MKHILLALLLGGCAMRSVDNPEPIDSITVRTQIRDSVFKKMRPCYERLIAVESKKNKDVSHLEGQITVYFEVNPEGKSQNFKVQKSEIKSPFVSDCIRMALEQTQFSAPPAGQEASIVYPFIFQAKD